MESSLTIVSFSVLTKMSQAEPPPQQAVLGGTEVTVGRKKAPYVHMCVVALESCVTVLSLHLFPAWNVLLPLLCSLSVLLMPRHMLQ